eukprot:SAG11_NODE_6090_length_1390_cov_1.560806_1_plen_122_part_00
MHVHQYSGLRLLRYVYNDSFLFSVRGRGMRGFQLLKMRPFSMPYRSTTLFRGVCRGSSNIVEAMLKKDAWCAHADFRSQDNRRCRMYNQRSIAAGGTMSVTVRLAARMCARAVETSVASWV